MSKSKIDRSLLSFPVLFQNIEDVVNDDCRFTKVKIWLMHLGENFNGSHFDKEVVDKAIPSLEYIPIVAFIENNKINELDCSDHRYVITKKDENGTERKYQGVAYGVITSSEDNNAHYEERLCDDGILRTFLVVDGLLWNMFKDCSEIINRDVIKSQSMELLDDENYIDGYEDENGIFHFTKFSFRASCILGKDYEPAMINSTIEVQFTMKDFIKELQSEMNNKLMTFAKLVNEKQGGLKVMPNIKQNTNFSQTVLNQFNDISNIVKQQEVMTNRWNETVPRFCLVDIQDNEVIVTDRKNNYNFYGFPFTINGDKPEIDFSCGGSRKKLRYDNYNEGNTSNDNQSESIFEFGKYIDELEASAYSKIQEAEQARDVSDKAKDIAETNYNKIKSDYDDLKVKYNKFEQAEQERIAKEIETNKLNEFAKYEDDLFDCAEFITLKEKKDDLSLDEVVSQCAILYSKKYLGKSNFTKSNTSSIVHGIIESNDFEDDNENFVTTKYGKIPINK